MVRVLEGEVKEVGDLGIIIMGDLARANYLQLQLIRITTLKRFIRSYSSCILKFVWNLHSKFCSFAPILLSQELSLKLSL